MRAGILTIAILLAAIMPAAAQSSPDTKTFVSAADIQALIVKAKADRQGNAPITTEPILVLDTYRANLEYRPIAGPAALHDTENEIMIVIQGSGTVTLGGAMVNPTRPNPTNESAPSISGGTSRPFNKGDALMVPHGTPHQISAVSDTLVLMTIHVPANVGH